MYWKIFYFIGCIIYTLLILFRPAILNDSIDKAFFFFSLGLGIFQTLHTSKKSKVLVTFLNSEVYDYQMGQKE